MKIGIIGCFYNCADLLPQVLAPWIESKQEGAPLVLTAINAQFKEYAELNYENTDGPTQALLQKYAAYFDLLHIDTNPLLENEVRNIGLRYLLEQKVDLVWLLDGDELYTKEQIYNILQFVVKTPQFDYYHLPFDNRAFGMKSKDIFAPPRIFRTDRRGGITIFVTDNAVAYGDGKDIYDSMPGIVPQSVAHVLHYTWDKRNAVEKINYHRRHFGYCPFTYNSDTKTFSFDESYFTLYNLPFPAIKDGYIEANKKRPAHIVLTLCKDAKKANDMLIKTLNALFGLERQNDFDIHFSVVALPEYMGHIRTVLEISPFTAEILEQVPKQQSGEDILYLDVKNLSGDSKQILADIRKHFKSRI